MLNIPNKILELLDIILGHEPELKRIWLATKIKDFDWLTPTEVIEEGNEEVVVHYLEDVITGYPD